LHEGRSESPKEVVKVEYLKRAQPQEEGVTQKVRDAVSEILSAVEKEGIAAARRTPSNSTTGTRSPSRSPRRR
jgi:hypothetical protein